MKNLNFYSPLEQFEISTWAPISFFGIFDISLNNASFSLLIAVLHFFLFFTYGWFNPKFIPTPVQAICEQSYLFILGIIEQQCGHRGFRYFPYIFCTFFLILFSNLIGLIPFAFTPTSHIAFTLSIAFTANFAFVIIGFKENKLAFLKLFVPKGGPKWLFPIIVVIEFVSYLLRTFSLSIRLFANMMAGHTLLHILSSFVTAFITGGYLTLSIFPFILVLAVFVLELGIAFLQAYVFVILLCIYLNDSFHPSH